MNDDGRNPIHYEATLTMTVKVYSKEDVPVLAYALRRADRILREEITDATGWSPAVLTQVVPVFAEKKVPA